MQVCSFSFYWMRVLKNYRAFISILIKDLFYKLHCQICCEIFNKNKLGFINDII